VISHATFRGRLQALLESTESRLRFDRVLAGSEAAVTCRAMSRLLSPSSVAVRRMRSPALVKVLTSSSTARRKLPVKNSRPA
jgi:hypothetical protein